MTPRSFVLSLGIVACVGILPVKSQKRNTDRQARNKQDRVEQVQKLDSEQRDLAATVHDVDAFNNLVMQLKGMYAELEVLMEKNDFRSIDGSGNNCQAHTPLLRMVGSPQIVSSPPNPREISNALAAVSGGTNNHIMASDMTWQWGQFIDHDFTLVEESGEHLDIDIPMCDDTFDKGCQGDQTMSFVRSNHEIKNGKREQINSITACIDGSNVYGSDDVRANFLRTFKDGLLKTTGDGKYLPYNDDKNPLPNAPHGKLLNMFLGGDVRANEQSGLLATHTIWVREHNTIAMALRLIFPKANDEALYQLARCIVGAEMQHTTYYEWLPLITGQLPKYEGYKKNIIPGIFNEFATAAFRFGHSLVSNQLMLMDANMQSGKESTMSLSEAFFNPKAFMGNEDMLLRGLCAQECQAMDWQVNDAMRNMLFANIDQFTGHPGGFDLLALNIQRGRDHELPSYNDVRAALGLKKRMTFAEMTGKAELAMALANVYPSVDNVDLFVGCIVETPMKGIILPETMQAIVTRQFEALRDGDRFYFENLLPTKIQGFIKSQKYSDIIKRNSQIGNEMPEAIMQIPQMETSVRNLRA